MGCNCGSKNRATASATTGTPGTYRVMVRDRKVYESTNANAAQAVAERFDNATVLGPGESK